MGELLQQVVEGLDGQVALLDGPATGDRIIVYSDKPLREGTRIDVVDALAGAAP